MVWRGRDKENLKENRKIMYVGSKEICIIYIKIGIIDEVFIIFL